jgi:hypothetical protein
MGRTPHIQADAKSTTVYLTRTQKAAIRKFQAKRLLETEGEPGLTEVIVEALRLLLGSEGWTAIELEQTFPKTELKRAKVSVFSKRRRTNRPVA